MDQNFLTIALVVVFAIMIFFMFRNSRKRRRDLEEMQSKLVPGVEVMTTQGIFGLLVSIDDEKNEAVIESTPGTRIRVHRQTLSRVVEPAAVAAESSTAGSDDGSAAAAIDGPASTHDADRPEYGERHVADTSAADAVAIAPEKPKRASRKPPTAE